MKRLLTFFIFAICFLHAESSSLFRNLVTESDSKASLDCVNLFSGQYVESRADLLCKGKEPLFFHSFFSSLICKEKEGGKWEIMPHLKLEHKYTKDGNEFEHRIKVKDANGTLFVFLEQEKHFRSMLKYYNKAIEGTSNTARGEISSKTNVANAALARDLKKDEFIIYLPDHTRRYYHKSRFDPDKKNKTYYRVYKEVKLNGYRLEYHYDGKGRLFKIETISPLERVYNYILIHYKEGSPSLTIENSQGQLLHYNFIVRKGRTFLSEFISPYLPKEVNYLEQPSGDLPFEVLAKQFGEVPRYYFEYGNIREDASWGKVTTLHSSFNIDTPKIKTNTISYNADYTEVRDSYHRKETYHFDSDHRLSYILRFSRDTDVDLLNSEEKFGWVRNTQAEQVLSPLGDGMNVLGSKTLSIGYDRRRYLHETFTYNGIGDITEWQQWGDFSGNGSEQHLVTKREYQRAVIDPFSRNSQLVKETNADGTFRTLEYLGATTLLTKELLHDAKGGILSRKFWRYDKENNLTLSIEDDGCGADIDDLSSVKVRKLVRLNLSEKKGCLGLPEVIREEFYNAKTRRNELLKKTVNHYDSKAQLIKQDIYDANESYAYSLHFGYDAMGRLIYTKDALGLEIRSEYGDLFQKVREEHVQTGLVIALEYDTCGRVIKRTETINSASRATSYTYDAKSLKQSETDYLGNTTYYEYDSRGNVVCIVSQLCFNADGSAVQSKCTMTYDDLSRLSSKTEGDGTRFIEYNCLGQITRERAVDGAETRTFYNLNQTIDFQILPDGSRIEYEYDALKRPLQIIHKKVQELANGTASARDLNRDLSRFSNPPPIGNRLGGEKFKDRDAGAASCQLLNHFVYKQGAKIEKFRYEGSLLVERVDSEGISTHFEYDGAGRLVWQKVGELVTSYTYDALGRQASETVCDVKTVTSYNYADQPLETKTFCSGKLIQAKELKYNSSKLVKESIVYTSSGPVTESFEYDGWGRLTATTNEEGHTTRIIYDDAALDPYFKKEIEGSYSLYDFPSQKELSYSQRPSKGRDVSEWMRSRKAERERVDNLAVHYVAKRPRPQVVSKLTLSKQPYVSKKVTISPSKRVTEEFYNALGQLSCIKKIGRDGKEYLLEEFVYDALGRKTKQISTIKYKEEVLELSETHWEYDSKGNAIAIIEAATSSEPKVTRMSYTFDNLLETLTKPNQVVLSYSYDDLRHLKKLTSSDGSIDYSYRYDTKGRLVRSKDEISGLEQSITYDANGNPVQEKLLPEIVVERRYDKACQKTELAIAGQKVSYRYEGQQLKKVMFGDYVHEFKTYDLSLALKEERLMNGDTILYRQDKALRTTYLKHKDLTHVISHIDEDGLVRKSLQTYFAAEYPVEYAYDELCQLKKETGTCGHSYGFDSHEVLREMDGALATSTKRHELTWLNGISYSYDANGNRASHSNWSYSYDALDRLISMAKPGLKLTFSYDSQHRRLAKKIERANCKPQTIFYLYDGDNEIGAISDGKLIEFRVLGATDAAEIGASVLLFLDSQYYIPLHDLFGNISILLPLKRAYSGTHAIYSAFGASRTYNRKGILKDEKSPWTYQSKREDKETGLIYFGRRFYDPHSLSFINPDPKGLAFIPNPYTYIHNNPLLHHDLYGLEPHTFNDFKSTMAEVMSNPRFQGAMQAFGGLSEASMGAGMTYATGGLAAPLGWPIMAHGLDHFVTGMSTVFTGKLRGSATAELLQKTGMSQNSAELIDSGISISSGRIGSHAMRSGSNLMKASFAVPKSILPNATGLAKEYKFKPFTERYYRSNLKELTRMSPPSNIHAHHIFPREYEKFFFRKGINIHDPKYLTWWKSSDHLSNHKSYNSAWANFLGKNPNISKEEILEKGRRMMNNYGVDVNY